MPTSGELDEFLVVKEENRLEDDTSFGSAARRTGQRSITPKRLKRFTPILVCRGRQEESCAVCIALDVTLAMSGTETVVESYYPDMKAGVKMMDIPTTRWSCAPTQIGSCRYPSSAHIAKMHLHGGSEVGVKAHRSESFFDIRSRAANKYARGGKVLDRLARKTNRALLPDEDRVLALGLICAVHVTTQTAIDTL